MSSLILAELEITTSFGNWFQAPIEKSYYEQSFEHEV